MKVAFAEDNVVNSQGLKDSAGFKINAGAHAFKILSSGLYSNKIAAVLREIGCNAADAHIMAGTPDLPFEVKLPNRIDSQFYIRDWGPGLSHDDVMGLYSTYFASTKQNSNDVTGAFGLGSKSPFSYTDSFMVASVHNGTKRVYASYLNNQGSPVTSLMNESPADKDWQHGLMIGFNVAHGDMHTFQAEAQNTYELFTVLPKIVGGQPIIRPTFTFESAQYNTWKGGHTILMGNVKYPLKIENLNLPSGSVHEAILNSGTNYILKMPIGSVKPTASREQLDYDPDTISALKQTIYNAGQKLSNEIEALFKKAHNGTWAEVCALPKSIKEIFVNAGTIRFTNFVRGMKIPNYMALCEICTRFSVPAGPKAGKAALCTLYQVYQGHKKTINSIPIYSGKYDVTGNNTDVRIPLEENTVIIYGVEKYSIPRIRKALLDGIHKQIIYIRHKTHPDIAEREAKELAAHFSMECKPLNDYDPPPVIQTVRIAKQKLKKAGKGLQTLPNVPVDVVSGTDLIASKMLDDVPNEEQFYLIKVSNSRWATDRVRLLNSDKTFDISEWRNIWHSYCTLRKAMNLPAQGYVFVTKPVYDSIGFEKFKWRCIYDEMILWIEDKATDTFFKNLAATYSPVVDLNVSLPSWVRPWPFISGLVHMKKKAPSIYDLLVPILQKRDVYNQIEGVFAASTNKNNTAIPLIILAYKSFLQVFGRVAHTAFTLGLEINAAEDKMRLRFPGLKHLMPENMQAPRDVLPAIIDAVLSKEIK